MKKRFLTVAVIMSMLLTLFPQNYAFAISGTKGDSIPVIDGETLLFAEAFDGYADKNAAVSAMASEYPNISGTSIGDNSGIMFQGNSNWGGAFDNSKSSPRTVTGNINSNGKRFGFFTHKDDVVTSGVVHVYFYLQRRSSTFSKQELRFFGYNGDTNYDYINSAFDFADTSDVNSFPVNTWVYVEAFIDLDNDVYFVTVRNDNTNEVVYSYSAAYTLDNFRGVVVWLALSSSSSASSICPLIDDLYIGKLNSTIPDDIAVPWNETEHYATNFETFESASAWRDDDALTDGGFRSWNDYGLVPGFSKFGTRRSARAFSPTYRSGNAQRSCEYYLPFANKADAESGKCFHIGFFYKPGTYATTNQIRLFPYKSGSQNINWDNYVEALSTSEATSIGNNWVYIDLVIDMCEGYMRKTITNAFTGNLITFDSVDISTLSDYGFYCLKWNYNAGGTSWTVTNSPAIDDFTAGELYTDEESIYSDAFDKYANLAALPSNYTTSATDFAYDKEGSGHGNAFSANCGKADSTWNICYFRPDTSFAMGQYHITFDIRIGTTGGANASCGGGSNNGSGVTIIPSSIKNYISATDWYKAEIIYDAGRARSSYKIFDSDGTEKTSGIQNDFNLSNADAMVSFIGWSASKASSTGSTWDGDSCYAIDNLHIGKYNDYIPTFTINTGSDPVTTTVIMTNRGAFNVNNLYVMLAAYDASGNLLGYSTSASTGPGAGRENFSLSSPSLSKPAGAVTYKAFLWRTYDKDGETIYKPMSEAVTAP